FEGGEGGAIAVDFRRPGVNASADGLFGQHPGPTWFQRIDSMAPLVWNVPAPLGETTERPAIHARGLQQFNPDHRRQLLLAQYNEFGPPANGGIQSLPPGMVKYEIFPRSDVAPNVTIDPKQGITTLAGGVRIVIEGLAVE